MRTGEPIGAPEFGNVDIGVFSYHPARLGGAKSRTSCLRHSNSA